MEKFEVVIVGAGPAGLEAAKILAGEKKVLVLERNPEIGPKVCAGGLTQKDFNLGIPVSLTERRFNTIKVLALKKIIEIQDRKVLVATINREKLGQWMLERIKNKVEIRTNSEVVAIQNNSCFLKNGQEIGFDFLIGADGSLSLVRKHLNLPTKRILTAFQYKIRGNFENLEIFFDKNLFGLGYVWIFPYQKYVLIGCGTDSRLKDSSLAENFHHWLKERKINYDPTQVQAATINFDYQGFNFGNIFLAGDAGGFASGLTGEGISFAILSGREIARKILNPQYSALGIKKILRMKLLEEKIGKTLLFFLLKREKIAQILIKKYLNLV